jgi:hypothetical protein
MAVPATINDISTTPASNAPASSDSVFPLLDDYLRTGFSFIAQLRDTKLASSAVSTFSLTPLAATSASAWRTAIGALGSATGVWIPDAGGTLRFYFDPAGPLYGQGGNLTNTQPVFIIIRKSDGAVCFSVQSDGRLSARADALYSDDVPRLGQVQSIATNTARTYRQLAQIATFQTSDFLTGTNPIPLDNTIPQSGEGDQFLSVTLTPTDAGSLLEVDVLLSCGTNVSTTAAAALFRDAGANALTATISTMPYAGDAAMQMRLHFFVTAGSTASTTFKVRAGAGGGGTLCLNGVPNTGAKFNGVESSRITVKEYLP